MIELQAATFGYGGRPVVRADRLSMHAGRCLGIFGANGSGKSTLIKGLMGLLPPMTGTVKHDPGARFAYVPQHRHMEAHWPMTALDAAAIAISARRRLGWVGSARHRVLDMMATLDVDSLHSQPFATLSGGQQQRVLLAGALATDPNVLLLDEPTEGLDLRSRGMLLSVIQDRIAAGTAVGIISHGVHDLIEVCHEVAWVHPGEEHGKPSIIEVISPVELGERVTQLRSVS